MSGDPLTNLAKQRIIRLSADLEVELATKPGGSIVIEILQRLRKNAAESMTALATCDFSEIKQVILLQNEVKRYDEYVGWLKQIVNEGRQYDQQMAAEEREEMLDYLSQQPDGEQQAINLGLLVDPRDG